jgi:hypothetical protein
MGTEGRGGIGKGNGGEGKGGKETGRDGPIDWTPPSLEIN